MNESNIHQLILDRLADLQAEQAATTAEVKNIVARLDKLNGKVYAHEVELAERRGADQASNHLTDHIFPVLRYAVGVVLAAVAVLALNHSTLFSVVK